MAGKGVGQQSLLIVAFSFFKFILKGGFFMQHPRWVLSVVSLLVLVACNSQLDSGLLSSQAASPKPRPVISNPFYEYSGYKGLKLGYGDVLAQCQSYDNTNNANPYTPFTSTVNVIVGDNYNLGAGVNQGCRTPQNETAIAVNPSNPNNLVAGANDYRDCCVQAADGSLRNDGSGYVYTSTDGGQTWLNIKLPGLGTLADPSGVAKKVTSIGDPAISFGKNNSVYYANIAFNRVDNSDAIFVSVSRDGGLTWGNPVLVANSGGGTFFNDKVWIGADPNSGKAYVSWTRFKTNPKYGYVESPIVVARTADYGKSWSDWVNASGPYPYDQGSVPVVAPNGAVYISFEAANPFDNFNDYNVVSKSTDGGKTWTQTVAGRNFDESYPVDPVLGRQTLTGLRFRINSFPALTVDRVTGKLYLVWADNRNGTTALTRSQVFMQASSDGLIWTAPQQLTSSPEDKIYPWVAANAGNVIVSYYSREFAGSASLEMDYAYVKSNNGGTTWSSSTRITEQSSDPSVQFTLGGFIGDYTGVALGSDNVAHPIWTDFRGKPGLTSPNQDAVTASIPLVP